MWDIYAIKRAAPVTNIVLYSISGCPCAVVCFVTMAELNASPVTTPSLQTTGPIVCEFLSFPKSKIVTWHAVIEAAAGGGLRGKLNKVVLAYSGGLDTSVVVPWLRYIIVSPFSFLPVFYYNHKFFIKKKFRFLLECLNGDLRPCWECADDLMGFINQASVL